MIARRCCCSAISDLFQTTRPRSVLVSHKQKNSSLLSSIDRSHFFFFVFFFERFFLCISKPRRLRCKSRSFLQFCSSETLLRERGVVVCVLFVRDRKKKEENFSSENLSTWSLLLFACSHASKISGNCCFFCVCGIKFQFSLPLHKIKTLLKGVLFNTRTRTVS